MPTSALLSTTQVPSELQLAFHAVHEQQRYGGPEQMFDAKHNPGVDFGTGIWTHALEHGGDLIHRSSYSGYKDFGGGGARYGREATMEKAQKLIRTFQPKPNWVPIALDVAEQITNNFRYRQSIGAYHGTIAQFHAEVKQAGERYALAYEALKPVTEVQQLGRNAAIAIGRFQFSLALGCLRRLVVLLEPHSWELAYWKPLAA